VERSWRHGGEVVEMSCRSRGKVLEMSWKRRAQVMERSWRGCGEILGTRRELIVMNSWNCLSVGTVAM